MKRGIYIRTKKIRKKISEKLKGRKIIFNKNSGFQKGNIPWNKNKKMLKKYCKKLSKIRKGHRYYGGGWKGGEKHSEETKKKLSIKRKKLYKQGKIEKMIGEKNPSWQGGKSFELYSKNWKKELINNIKKRDKYTCFICKIKIKESRRIKNNPSKNWLTVHHINYSKKDCNSENLITLCQSCHGKTNYNRIRWRLFFNDIK